MTLSTKKYEKLYFGQKKVYHAKDFGVISKVDVIKFTKKNSGNVFFIFFFTKKSLNFSALKSSF